MILKFVCIIYNEVMDLKHCSTEGGGGGERYPLQSPLETSLYVPFPPETPSGYVIGVQPFRIPQLYHKDDTQTDKETNRQYIFKHTIFSPFLHELFAYYYAHEQLISPPPSYRDLRPCT